MKKQWMTAFGLIGMIAAIIWACHKEQPVTITPAEQQLSLVSPEGYALAGSVAELKKDLATHLSRTLDQKVAPHNITIHDIEYMGDERVRAASIIVSSPDQTYSLLRILHVAPGMAFVNDGNVLSFKEIPDAEVMTACCPDIPDYVICFGKCTDEKRACHWICDPGFDCMGNHYPSPKDSKTIFFICDCKCRKYVPTEDLDPNDLIKERCWVIPPPKPHDDH